MWDTFYLVKQIVVFRVLRFSGNITGNKTRLEHSRNEVRMPCVAFTLWLFNIAMENGPFIDGLPITNGDFPWLC